MKKYVLQQLDYHAWANQILCTHLQHLSAEVYRKEIVSVFPTIYAAMQHIYVIDRGWMSFFTSGGVPEMNEEYVERLMCSINTIVEETRDKRIEELGERMAELAGQLHQFIDQHDNIEVVYPSGTFSARCVDYIQHLVNHGTYHRGNVTAMLRQLGHAGTPTDYGYYLYTLSQ